MQSNADFLERRRKLASSWKIVAWMMLAGIAALAAWLFVSVPWLANPLFVARRISAGDMERPTLELMATVLPVTILILLGLIAAMIGLGFAIFANEKRYQRIIRELEARSRHGA